MPYHVERRTSRYTVCIGCDCLSATSVVAAAVDYNCIIIEANSLLCLTTGVISVSWYPPGLADNEGHNVDSLIPLLLQEADRQQLKVFKNAFYVFL